MVLERLSSGREVFDKISGSQIIGVTELEQPLAIGPASELCGSEEAETSKANRVSGGLEMDITREPSYGGVVLAESSGFALLCLSTCDIFGILQLVF